MTPPGIQALVYETLRLYPSSRIPPGRTTEDAPLAGYTVEAGTHLLVCRDPARTGPRAGLGLHSRSANRPPCSNA